MPRNMSFSLTTEQIINKTKTVTRRKGWRFLRPGDEVMACRKCMGLKPGEKIQRLGLIKIVSVDRRPLGVITSKDVGAEGFPEKSARWFINMFIGHFGGDVSQTVTRIEFEYI